MKTQLTSGGTGTNMVSECPDLVLVGLVVTGIWVFFIDVAGQDQSPWRHLVWLGHRFRKRCLRRLAAASLRKSLSFVITPGVGAIETVVEKPESRTVEMGEASIA
ncbi:hypothetical protein GCM10008094_20050 [Aidingimonas halophila]|nr:hypothetical protein GCM10008094_20050 [Aidingimonas halophila]